MAQGSNEVVLLLAWLEVCCVGWGLLLGLNLLETFLGAGHDADALRSLIRARLVYLKHLRYAVVGAQICRVLILWIVGGFPGKLLVDVRQRTGRSRFNLGLGHHANVLFGSWIAND